ncbi:MAG: hypothetical protein ABI305_07920 [Tepidiformaceae bacterium]
MLTSVAAMGMTDGAAGVIEYSFGIFWRHAMQTHLWFVVLIPVEAVIVQQYIPS